VTDHDGWPMSSGAQLDVVVGRDDSFLTRSLQFAS
jgi:hypothetical protein